MKLRTALIAGLALTAGLLFTVAAPAQAEPLGTVELSQQNGNVNDSPMFASGTTSSPCPATYGEEASLRVGPAETGPFANLAPALGGGGFDTAPVTVNPTRSFAVALGAAPTDGAWWIVVECFSLTAGRHPERFVSPITVCGAQWQAGAGTTCATPTQTTLGVDPAGPVEVGTEVTFTVGVTPAEAAGTVLLRRTTTPLLGGPPSIVDIDTVEMTDGAATLAVPDLPAGSHVLNAIFTPADEATYAGSAAPPVTLVVTQPGTATPTTTTLTADPASPQPSGAEVTLTAHVSPDSAPGSVEFSRRTAENGADFVPLGTVPVTSGVATLAVDTLPVGSLTLKADFVPTDPTAFQNSTASIPYQITGPGGGGAATTTTLTVDPGSPQVEGTVLTLTALVAPGTAAGQVRFTDGGTVLGTQPVVTGTAGVTVSNLVVGTHSLAAEFIPTNPGAFLGSQSTTVSFVVTTDDSGGGGNLPVTGVPLLIVLGVGAALVAGGLGVRRLGRGSLVLPGVRWPDDPAPR